MSVPKGPRFKELAAALEAECERLGFRLEPGQAAEVLQHAVQSTADRVGIKPATVLRNHIGDRWPSDMAATLARETEQAMATVASADGAPVAMPLLVAAQLVMALGQAAKFGSLNAQHARTNECLTVILSAGDAQTALGAAIRASSGDRDREAELRGLAVDRAPLMQGRYALDIFAKRLSDGTWHEHYDGQTSPSGVIDLASLAEQVRKDAALMAEVLES